jgi:hypothetical protein
MIELGVAHAFRVSVVPAVVDEDRDGLPAIGYHGLDIDGQAKGPEMARSRGPVAGHPATVYK